MRRNRCVAFTGGGTAGHVFPALSVARLVGRSRDGRIIWIGSSTGMERRLLQGQPYRYFGIPTGKWRRYLSVRNLLDVFSVAAGFLRSVLVLLRERPVLLFSKGGYVSVPPVLAARCLGIPVFTHESDFDPGLATRLNARSAERILVSFERTRAYFPPGLRSRVVVTGNPVRPEFLEADARRGRRLVGAGDGRPVILVLGGSQGASRINTLIAEVIDRLAGRWFVVHQMGEREFRPSDRDGYVTAPFWTRGFPDILACADLVVCRAGANTLAEIAVIGRPAVLIPLPLSGSRGDQIRNARFFSERGAAAVFDQERGGSAELLSLIESLMADGGGLERMGGRMRGLSRPRAAERIAELILERIA